MLYKEFSKQEEIDEQYNPRLKTKNVPELLQRILDNSARIRSQHDHQLDIQYGPTLAEHFDYFPTKVNKAPLHVFIHGGYWHSFTSKEFALVAEVFLENNINVALLNYALCPHVTLDEIVRQCRAALAFLYKNNLALGYDPQQISISGHSAGGHLVGMMLSTDWENQYGLPANLIQSSCAISGLFDLAPFPYSWLQPKLQLSWDQVKRNSPLHHHPPPSSGPVIVTVGSEESSEFHIQSESYVNVLKQHGYSVDYLDLEGKNHFTILDEFHGQGGNLFQKILSNITGKSE